MKSKGGQRAGAGRKTMFDLETIMALHLRVNELRAKTPTLSKKAALRIMQTKGEIPDGPLEHYLRYLTPGYLRNDIREVLSRLSDRSGIVSTIKISKSLKHTPKNKKGQ
jgi:hypothetical protein